MLEHLFSAMRGKNSRTLRKKMGDFNYKHRGLQKTHSRPGLIEPKTRYELLKVN